MLSDILRGKNIILASNSPRRKQFLETLNIPFKVIPSNVDETYPLHYTKEEITQHIALAKANSFKPLTDQTLIIACDTIVWHENKALGKPTSKEDAFRMLRSISNTSHEVISSVCLKTIDQTIVFSDHTDVTFGPISDQEIEHYIQHFKPYDKAGAYGIQEWIGIIGVQKINGSYTNVVGMPMEKLYHQLKNL